MNRSHLLLTLIALTVCWCSTAQEPAYLHYSVADGLPSAMVYCSYQDQDGYLWFGTTNGLARFDGTRFKVFDIRDGLLDNEVIGIYEDSKRRLWVSSFGKTPIYLKGHKIVTEQQDSLPKSISITSATQFFEDSQQRLWVCGGDRELVLVEGNSAKKIYKKYPVRRIGEFGKDIFNLTFWAIVNSQEGADQDDSYYMPSPFFDVHESKDFEETVLHTDNELKTKCRFVFMSHIGNRVLYSFTEGILLIEYGENGFKEIDRLMGISVVGIHADKSGKFWVILDEGGVVYFDAKSNSLVPSKVFLPSRKISSIQEDRENNIIFTTLDDGVYFLPNNAALTYKSGGNSPLRSDNITAVGVLDNGTVAIGDNSGNLYLKRKSTWVLATNPKLTGDGRIRQLIPLPNGNCIAIADKAVFSTKDGALVTKKMIGAHKSASLGKSGFWLGTSHYLIKLNDNFENMEIVQKTRAMAVQADESGNIWTGGLNGLASEMDGFSKAWHHKFPQLSSRIIDIEKAEGYGLWVVTQAYGLIKAKVQDGGIVGVEVVNDQLTAAIENIQSVFEDKKGVVWLATNKGVFSVNRSWEVARYDQSNGLIANDVNDVAVQNDTLWAATVKGLSKILLTGQNESDNFASLIVGIRYTLDSKRISEWKYANTKEFVLAPNTTMLEIDLAGLHFKTRGNLFFIFETRDKLLPLQYLTFNNLFNALFGSPDTAIVEGSVRNFGVNIAPGRYHAIATAFLPGGVVSQSSDAVMITILPNWWQTVWVWLAVLGLVAAFLWRLLMARENYLSLQNMNSELQLQAIRAQMNPHFVGNSINAIQQFFYPPDPVKASQFISIFSDLLRRTLHFSERDFIRFEEELSYIKDYLEMIRLRFGERFQFEITGSESIPSETAFPAMLLQPIIENSTIHGLSPDGTSQLGVNFQHSDGWVFCAVSDNGVGIEASKKRKQHWHGVKRVSKGLILLEKKAMTLNKLYQTQIKIETIDRSTLGDELHGTLTIIKFIPPDRVTVRSEF